MLNWFIFKRHWSYAMTYIAGKPRLFAESVDNPIAIVQTAAL